MAQRDSLRERYEQHKPKNKVSKAEDKNVALAAQKVIEYLKERFHDTFFGNIINDNIIYDLSYETTIKIKDMIKFITRKDYRKWDEFDHTFDNKEIRPDGGVIYLEKIRLEIITTKDNKEDLQIEVLEKYPLVIAEVKHQGTNDDLLKEGKKMQAFGNAIERLGKNLVGIRAMMHYESITPFICFGDGCDFALPDEIDEIVEEYKDNQFYTVEVLKDKFVSGTTTVRAKVFTLNEFYDLNRIIIFKKNKSLDDGPFAPVSMMFRYNPWTVEEMFEYMKEIAETSFRYYTM